MSKRIRVIWYKAAWDKHWLDNAISLWTGLISAKNRKVGPYSHVEIWTADEQGRFSHIIERWVPAVDVESNTDITGHNQQCERKDIYTGTCWTSTMRGEDNGTVKRPASTVIENAERWDYCEIELDGCDYGHLIGSMTEDIAKNKGYSKRDLWRFFLPFHRNDKSRDICSEFVNDNLYVIGKVEEMDIPSPRRLAWKLKKAGYVIKSLKGE